MRCLCEVDDSGTALPVRSFAERVLYHGSNSPSIQGALYTNKRDFGWFGAGFYLTAHLSYALRWGKYVYEMRIPVGKYARLSTNYRTTSYDTDALEAHLYAGGDDGWILDEHLYAEKFTHYLMGKGYVGVRIALSNTSGGYDDDVEVVVFDPTTIQVVRRII